MKKVSVVIPAFNEEEHILACIESLKNQSIPLEIIVVDDGSTDDTRALISRYSEVTIVTQDHLGAGAARNLGVTKAGGDIIVFLDADMTFDKSFVEALVKPIWAESVVGTASRNEFVANMDNPIARSWSIIRGFKDGRMHSQTASTHQPVFRAITKEIFEEAGGFDKSRGYDDDWSLSEKIGQQALLVDTPKFYHANPGTLQEIFEQSKWMAKRRYKLGIFGAFVAAVRSNILFSCIKGAFWAIKHQVPIVLVVTLVSDFGIVMGITERFFSSKVGR